MAEPKSVYEWQRTLRNYKAHKKFMSDLGKKKRKRKKKVVDKLQAIHESGMKNTTMYPIIDLAVPEDVRKSVDNFLSDYL